MTQKRQDILVSVVVDGHYTSDQYHFLNAIHAELKKQFAFFEILIAHRLDTQDVAQAASDFQNIRFFQIEDDISSYATRPLLMAETIGDIVIFMPADIDYIQYIMAMISESEKENKIIYMKRHKKSLLDKILEIASRDSRLLVSTKITAMILFNRDAALDALNRPDSELALRFPPRSSRRAKPINVNIKRRGGNLRNRCRLLYAMSVNLTPKLLGFAWIMALALMIASIITAFYTLAVYVFKPTVAEGWTTTNLFLSAGGFFSGFFALAILGAIQYIITHSTKPRSSHILSETTKIDVFGSVKRNKNVVEDPS